MGIWEAGVTRSACGLGLCLPGSNLFISPVGWEAPVCSPPHLGTDHSRGFQAKDTARAEAPKPECGEGGGH